MNKLPSWTRELPAVQHKLFNDLLDVLVEFYKEHVRRDVDSGRLVPVDAWVMLRGFLVAGMQTYASICILLADNRPKRLMLQAAILNRALFEILATVLAASQELGTRTQKLARDYYRTLALIYAHRAERFGPDPEWSQYLRVYQQYLDTIAQKLGLQPELTQNPRTIEEWPTPGAMVRKSSNSQVAPFLSDTRLSVVEEIYKFHYGGLSAQAHGRAASVAAALLVDEPSLQWNPGYGESDIILSALIFMACILSEVQHLGGYAKHPKLGELWAYLREFHGEAKDLWCLRYEELCGSISST